MATQPDPTDSALSPRTQQSPSIKLVPVEATEAEMLAINKVRDAAYGTDALMELCFPPECHVDSDEEMQRNLARLSDPRFMTTKAIDSDSGRILGVAFWYWAEDPEAETVEGPFGAWPAGANVACLDASLGTLREWRVQHFRERNQPHLYLAMLIVDPEYQRRGIGTALLQDGLDKADHRGFPAFLEASPAGLGLYKKMGWEEKLQSDVNLKDYGGKEDHIESNVAMVREPQRSEAGKPTATAS